MNPNPNLSPAATRRPHSPECAAVKSNGKLPCDCGAR
jgi:hypothetical protein